MTQSETQITAVPTAADTWKSFTSMSVPAGVARINRVRCSLAPDWGTSAISVRMAPIFRLQGSGIAEQSPHVLLGAFGGVATATFGSASSSDDAMDYEVDIPVNVGGLIDPQVNTLTEAVTAGTCGINLYYDATAAQAPNSQSDYVSAAGTTTADAWAAIDTFTVPTGTNGKPPTCIRAIVVGCAPDQGTSAIALRGHLRVRLTGSGINEGGNHEYIGPVFCSNQQGSSVTATASHWKLTVVIPVNIPVNPAGQIKAEQLFDVETPTASTVAMGLLYG